MVLQDWYQIVTPATLKADCMIVFPNAKINLGLRILRKRTDGYHDIQSYMLPVNLCDALEIVPSYDTFGYSSSGLPIAGDEEDNLCVKAVRLMESYYEIPPVKVHLHKIIPSGSGLGGGSSNGAFALSLLRRLYAMKLCNAELEGLAAVLGCDCPFFVINKAQLIEGTGHPTHKFIHLPDYDIVIVVPKLSISTTWAYSIITPSGTKLPSHEEVVDNEENWKDMMVNDFEAPIFSHFPELAHIKRTLYEAGAFYASMSGSGSAVYGLFKSKPDVSGLFKDHFVWVGKTIS